MGEKIDALKDNTDLLLVHDGEGGNWEEEVGKDHEREQVNKSFVKAMFSTTGCSITLSAVITWMNRSVEECGFPFNNEILALT